MDKFLQAEQGNFIPSKILLQEEMKMTAMEFKNKQVLGLQKQIEDLQKQNNYNRNIINLKKTQEHYLHTVYDFKESLNLSYISNSVKHNVNSSIYKERRVSITSNTPTVACDSVNSNKNQSNSLAQEIYDTSKITCKNTTRIEQGNNIDRRLLDNSFHSGNDFYLSRSIISNVANSECNRNWGFQDIDVEETIKNRQTLDIDLETGEKIIREKKDTENKKKKKPTTKKPTCKLPNASSIQNRKSNNLGIPSNSINGNFQSTPFSINSSNVKRKAPKN